MTAARRSPLAPAVAAVAAAAALAACGAGRHNQNFQERPTTDASMADYGGVELRDVIIASPARVGQPALVTFSLYRRDMGPTESLTALSLPSLSPRPLQLLEVTGGTQRPVQEIPIDFQSSPGQRQFAATAPSVTTELRPATYVDATFTFARIGDRTLKIPVRTIGAAQPGSTIVPTIIPDVPHPAASGLPGGVPAGPPEAQKSGGS